jgi:hypothetical protein
MDSDDFYGSEGPEKDDATTRKVSSKLYNDGYRIGKAKEEEVQMQSGFDVGFERGMRAGRVCGQLYACCREWLSRRPSDESNLSVISRLEEHLFTCISEDASITEENIDDIRLVVLSISAELLPAILIFEEKIKLLSIL